MKLEGEKVILRWPKIQDAEWLYENITKPEIAINLQVSTTKGLTLEKEKKWIRSQKAKRDKNKGYTFVVIDKNTKKLLGSCGVKDVDVYNSNCEIGYWLAKPCWGKGYASDFLQLLLNFCFRELDLNKVWAYTADFNVRSQGLLKKNGFKQVGKLRKHTLVNNKFIDSIYFDLLKSEWKKNAND